MDDFQQILTGLNENQRRAVEQIEGPVLVVAGPGTGKTHILAARIGQILRETDTPPASILCLTFTDAAAHQMRERLTQFIGPDAQRVPISTFHSFCNRVIQENLDFFGRHDLELISEIERIELIRRLLDGLRPDHPLKKNRRDAYFFERHLADFFALMKREDWSPRHVSTQINAYLESLPTRKTFVYQRKTKQNDIGDLKTELLAEAREKMERLAAAAELFPKFKWAMEQARRYDYDDMISWVGRAFAENTALLRTYQERFLYFLVDEYQDTNGAQNHLLRRLLDFWQSPNVFIVGDDDQSIFEFQGARLKNLLDFFNDFRDDARLEVLTENYRSSQPILDAARRLIEKNEIRLINSIENQSEKTSRQSFDKKLTAQNPAVAASKIEPQILVFENRLHEEAEICQQIEALKMLGEPLDEIAIIYAQHRQAERLMSLFEKKGLPFQTRRPANVLAQPLISQLRDLLKYLEIESREPFGGEAFLFRILHFRFLGFAASEVAMFISKKETDRPIRLQLLENQQFSSFSEKLNIWLADLHELPLPHFLEKIINESGLLAHVLAQPEKVWSLQIITTFLEFSKTETARQPRTTLARFLEMLENLEANRLPISVQQTIRTGAAGVHFLTAHGAKGLEFRRVFMLDCTRDFWENQKQASQNRFALPDSLTFSHEEDATEARRRLFYVAMTRAKEFLTLSFAKNGADGKPLAHSIFLDETGLKPTQVVENEELMFDAQTTLLLAAPRPRAEMPPPEILDDLLEGFTLSISAMNRFLRCPLSFFYENVLQIPKTASESALFGSAMHHALMRFFEKMKGSKKKEFGSAADLVAFFETKMEATRGWFSAVGFEQKMGLGRSILENYHAEFSSKWRKNVVVERRFDRVELDGVPLTGVIDKLEFLENHAAHVVDYKTGRPDASKTAAPDDKNELGGDFWRQLGFYKILVDESRSLAVGTTVSSGSVAWLEPDRTGRFIEKTIVYSIENIHFIKKLIKTVWEKISRREFAEGCGKPDCAWCRLHLDNRSATDFSENDIENLDDD